MNTTGRAATPVIAPTMDDGAPSLRPAFGATAEAPSCEPVAAVTLVSAGRLLIVGDAAAACGWAERTHDKLDTTVLACVAGAPPDAPINGRYAVISGRPLQLDGHLGAFRIDWRDAGDVPRSDTFDLVLDLTQPPLLRRVELPDGYQAPGRDPLDQALAVIELLPLVGEFEKPQYVALRRNLCAHSRAGQTGCSRCIEACASAAIVADGDTVRVDPYLCQGCGSCATVCPSGALSYQFPRVRDVGERMRAMLAAYREAGGEAACLLFHSAKAGPERLHRLARSDAGLPARVLPVETWSADAVGLDLLLCAFALGAAQVAVLVDAGHDTAPLAAQARIGEAILGGLGYAGEHVRVIDDTDADAVDAMLHDWPAAAAVAIPAGFRPLDDKRATLDLAIAHLRQQSPRPPREIALPAGAPFGSIGASDACTLCMGCVGSCPAGALVGGGDTPRLSFIEHNCLQCGLCVNSCPEHALSMTPRLLLDGSRRERVLREAEIFRCIGCGKPLGARPLIEAMLGRLAGHSMFAADGALERLKMCADCRVIDLVKHEQSLQASEMRE